MTKSLYFWLMTLLLRSSFTAGLPVYQELLASRHDVVQAGIRPRSEIDLTTEKQVLFCAGQNKSLECVSPGSTIAIMDTFWGRLTDKICPSEDGDPTTSCGSDSSTTPLLKKLCDDKVFCEIPARHTVLQAPGTTHCPGVNKYLIVNYTCIPVERKFVLCDGETTNLNCGEGWKLNILSAIWGRMSPATCATTLGRPSRLGKCDNSNSTLEKVRSICHGRNGCIVRADDGHMIEGNAQHCPDVDKYAVISYRCQPRVEQESFLNSDQGMAPDSTKTIPFVNHDSQSNEYHSTPHLLQATPPNTPSPQQPNQNPESSLDGLLKEYMESQKNKGDTTTGEQLSVPHDVGPPLHPKEKLSVPQDGATGGIQQNIDLLEKILHSKNLMKVGIDAMEGIDMATAVNEPHGYIGPKNNQSISKQLDLTQDELNHLAHSPDAIKIINEYMNKNKTSQATPLIVSQQATQGSKQTSTSKPTSASSNSNYFAAQNEAFGTNGNKENFDTIGSGKLSSTTATTQKPSPITTSESTVKDLSKVMDPTAKLGGKVMGNMFYDKYLKPEQEHLENQAKNGDKNAEGKAIGILRTKVSALQAISDALSLITSKIDQAEGEGKRHHAGKKTSKQQEGNTVHIDGSDSVQPKDVQFLQDKINKAIETTETMERQAAIKHPSLVALKLRGKVAQDVQAETRNNVEQRKERLKIDKQIKDIEDSFNMLIEKAEKSGKFSDRDINKKLPTRNLFEELQSGALKMPFNDEPTRKPDNSAKGIYGFEVVSQEPVINVINERDNSTQSNKINTSNTTINAFKKRPEEINVHTPLDTPRAKEPSATVKLALQTASKAANSIANALRRQASNQSLYTVALKPITTFNNIQDVTLGGRINSEVLKEKKKEKLYQGKDVGAILNMIKARPTTKVTLVQLANQPLIPAKDMKMTGNNIQSPGKDEQAAKVQTVGTLDEKSAKLLSVLVQGFLEHNKNDNKIQTRHRRKKKKKKKMEQTEPEDEDFVIGAKHDEMGKTKDSQTNVLDNDLLEMLEQQLSNAQKYGYKIENLVSDIQDNEGEEDETVKSVPTDKEKEKEATEDSRLLSPTNKPMPAPSDDPSIELISKYTEGKSLQSMLLALQKMLKQGKTEIENEKKVGTSSTELITEESASKSSLSTKPHVVEFSEAATSGKIVNSLDDGKVSKNKDIQKITQFAGGRILEPASTTGMKAVSQQTVSVINSNPTTKSSVGAALDNKPTSKIKLAKLVKGVKLLLKALRGRNLQSHFGRHHEGKLEESDDQDGKDDGFDSETHEDFNENLLRDKENRKQAESEGYNGFFDFTEPRQKESSNWYVGEGNSYKTKSYQYDEQYDTNLAQQFASNPKEYSTFTPNIYSGPYTSFALQPSNSYGYSDKQALQDPFEKAAYKLPGPAKHALNSALKNDPIIQAVEEFSDKESQLYNEKLRGIQKNRIPRKNITQN